MKYLATIAAVLCLACHALGQRDPNPSVPTSSYGRALIKKPSIQAMRDYLSITNGGGLSSNEVYQIVMLYGGGTNGGGGVVSNGTATLVISTWYTNTSANSLWVIAAVNLQGGAAINAQCRVDVDFSPPDGTADWWRRVVFNAAATGDVFTDVKEISVVVPPGAAFQFLDDSTSGSVVVDNVSQLIYLGGTNSGGGSSFDGNATNLAHYGKANFLDGVIVAASISTSNTFFDTGNPVSVGTNNASGATLNVQGNLRAVGSPAFYLPTSASHTIFQTTTGGPAFLSYSVAADTLVFDRPPLGDGGSLSNLNVSIADMGQPAMTAFSAHATIAGASLTANGEYGWNFRLTRPLKVYALGKYRITGNTNVVSLQIRRTNDCALIAQTTLNTSLADSNQFNYAMLPSPVLLTTNYSYSITFTHPVGGTDSTLGITTGTETITTADGIIPIYAVSASVTCSGFASWPSNAYGMVNFLSYPGDEGQGALTVTKQVDTSGGSIPLKYEKLITAPDSSVNVSLLNSFNAPPQDVGRFLKRPWRSMDPFLDFYPNSPDVGAFTNTILVWKTNGMRDAGWDAVSLDDGWQSTTRTTSNSLTWDTSKFPLGLPWLVQFAHTNGFKIGTYFGWSTNNCLSSYPGSPYWTFKDPVTGRIVENQLSNDVYNAYAWGFDMLFYDNSCGPQSQSEEEVRAAIRIFNDVTLKSGLPSGRTNRGMIIQISGNSFGNDLTNSMMPYDVALGVNSWVLNGNENSIASPINGENTFYTKTKQTFEIPWFIQRGHYPTALLFNGSLSEPHVRILMSSYVMAPLSILISTSSVTAGTLPYFTNATWIRHFDDAATIPGRSIHPNNGRAEIWMRPFGSEVSQTNLICFINANTTNNTLNFSNSFLGFDASKRLTFTEIFTGTNYYVTNGYWPYVQTPSNAVTFVVYPTPSVTNVVYPRTHAMAGTGVSTADPNSTTAAPHYFVESWSQTAANNVAYNGFHIEPDVREVTANYYSVSDANLDVFWVDTWTTYYNSASAAVRGG